MRQWGSTGAVIAQPIRASSDLRKIRAAAADARKAKRVVDWQPSTSFKDMLVGAAARTGRFQRTA